MMRFGIALPLVAALGALAQPVSAQIGASREDTAAVDADVLHPGDVVRITVWRKPEISGEYPIAASGSIADPFYMELFVGGLPLATAIERIRAHVAQFEVSPRVLVEPLYRVSISGEVRQPALYNLPPGTTVAQAVLSAGGLTERARASRVVLVRGTQTQEVDLTLDGADEGALPVRSADQVIVPRRASLMRDYIAPASSVIAASFSIISVLLRSR